MDKYTCDTCVQVADDVACYQCPRNDQWEILLTCRSHATERSHLHAHSAEASEATQQVYWYQLGTLLVMHTEANIPMLNNESSAFCVCS